MSAAGNLGARLAQLERQVSALMASASGGETMTPSYLTVTPAGNVGAQFTGLVNALGLIIPASATGSPAPANSIQWQRQSDGAVNAQIDASASSPTQAAQMDIFAQSQDTNKAGIVQLFGEGSAGSRAFLFASSGDGPGFADVDTRVTFTLNHQGGGAASGILLDAAGRSTFLQLLSTQKLQLALGQASFAGNGTASVNPAATINTGLATIQAAGAWPSPNGDGGAWGGYLSAVGAAPGALTFAANTNGTFASGHSYDLFWIAIG